MALSGLARADILIGPNGERLPGRIVEESNGVLIFDSDFLGRLQIRSDQARVERSPPLAASAPSTAVAIPPAAAVADWSADLIGKLSIDRGSLKTAEDKLDATLKLERATAQGELHSTLEYRYKSTAGELKDNDWSASLSYDRFLSGRRFAAGRLLATNELTSEGYDSTETLSLATGWRLAETPEHYLRIGPAVGYVAIGRGSQNFTGPAVGLYARAKGPIVGRMSFTSELQWLDTLGDGRYANLEFRLRHPLGQRLYLALVWDYVWSDFDIESGITSEWRWDIGWRFGPEETK